jgi:hypothetical protein
MEIVGSLSSGSMDSTVGRDVELAGYVPPFFQADASPGLRLGLPVGGVCVYKKRLLLV